jgi:hypothetical protein
VADAQVAVILSPLLLPHYSGLTYQDMADSQRWGGDMDSVYLVLLCDGEEKTGLKIPLIDMRRNFKRPLKCLRAMALAVLGVSGHISVEVGGPAVANAELQSLEPELGGKVYHYVMDVRTRLTYP